MSTIECRTVLAGGVLATVTATRRARAGRADVKCSAAGDPALAERMQQVVRLARHTEARLDSRDQVVISIDRAPGRHERDWAWCWPTAWCAACGRAGPASRPMAGRGNGSWDGSKGMTARLLEQCWAARTGWRTWEA